jgi:hypothetical protein
MIVAIIDEVNNTVKNIVEVEGLDIAKNHFPHEICIESPIDKPAHIGLLYSNTEGFQQPEVSFQTTITIPKEIPDALKKWAEHNLDKDGNPLEHPTDDPLAANPTSPNDIVFVQNN